MYLLNTLLTFLVATIGIVHLDNYENDSYEELKNKIIELTNKLFKKN